jgi:hypothetical protein
VPLALDLALGLFDAIRRRTTLGNFRVSVSVLRDDPRTHNCVRGADHNRGGDSVVERRSTVSVQQVEASLAR